MHARSAGCCAQLDSGSAGTECCVFGREQCRTVSRTCPQSAMRDARKCETSALTAGQKRTWKGPGCCLPVLAVQQEPNELQGGCALPASLQRACLKVARTVCYWASSHSRLKCGNRGNSAVRAGVYCCMLAPMEQHWLAAKSACHGNLLLCQHRTGPLNGLAAADRHDTCQAQAQHQAHGEQLQRPHSFPLAGRTQVIGLFKLDALSVCV